MLEGTRRYLYICKSSIAIRRAVSRSNPSSSAREILAAARGKRSAAGPAALGSGSEMLTLQGPENDYRSWICVAGALVVSLFESEASVGNAIGRSLGGSGQFPASPFHPSTASTGSFCANPLPAGVLSQQVEPSLQGARNKKRTAGRKRGVWRGCACPDTPIRRRSGPT